MLWKPQTLKAKCPGLFTGLGKRRGPDYSIKQTPEAKPFALSTPKKVPRRDKAKLWRNDKLFWETTSKKTTSLLTMVKE